MASSFLEKMAKKQAEELEKKYGSSAYGGTTWLNNQLTGKKSSTDDDIAPVSTIKKYSETQKAKEEDEERTWFKASDLWDDGYQFGDISKTILGTGEDLLRNIGGGLVGIGEKVVDALATVAPYVAQGQYYQNGGGFNIQADQAFNSAIAVQKEGTKEFVKKDLYDEKKVSDAIIGGTVGLANDAMGIDSEKHSVFGTKSDELAQSAGQLVGQVVANKIVPGSGMALMGLTSFGSEAEGALMNGANLDEAVLSGAISAGAEMLTEKIGGISFGGKTLTDAMFSKLSKNMTNKLAKFLITSGKVAADATAEGFEEILSGYFGAIGQKLTYMNDKEIEELFSKEDLLDSFIGGVVLGGIGGAGDAVKQTIHGVDPVSGLTKNEKAVVDKEYNNRVKEAEEGGKKLTNSEKTELYDQVMNDMERGDISTDVIEEVLGDRKAYDALSKEAEEFKTLYETESGKLSEKQKDRLAELKAKNEANPYKTAVEAEKAKHANNVFELVKNDRLVESYNEKGKRGQAFKADLSQYDEKQRATIQSAIDSGILNNTRKTHEFVDLVARISADKGVPFDFTNNKKLKESMFAIEGKTVNGYFDSKTKRIGININSSKALNTVVGHEVTHVLEGTKLYDALSEAVKNYEISKNGLDSYNKKISELESLYKGVENASAELELVSDLVGEYLFTDSDFVNRLSTENRNVFEKIFDEIKYLCKVATAGSAEARQLEKVKKAFEDAYRAEAKNGEQEVNNFSSLSSEQKQITEEQNEQGLDRKQEVDFSLARDTEFSDNAIAKNNQAMLVDPDLMSQAKVVREQIAARMNQIKDKGLVGLPDDVEGNTFIANSSYDGTEENTTICPRSLASEAFVDAVSEYLGRPLTVEEQIYISQDLQGRSLTPECTYCYVATDRKAYRAFLGDYISQRDAVLEDYESGNWDVKTYTNEQIQKMTDEQKENSLYVKFLDGRKPTANMASRFNMWIKAAQNGTPLVQASDLANINKLMGDINSAFGAELKPQIVDAMKYAQSASWAKKRVNYVAYNGHILKWKQDRINKLNSHYGLRMYSFSDFHPAFVLENMQMITDASVRGLKMLGYTKDTDFVEIFAPSGMNINISTFGFETGGNVYENNIIGAEWEKAKALREQYPNVGITFVATNDTLVEWALAQEWIDVVIPYHLVRTGTEVAKAFGYTNYTSESADTKAKDWSKGDKKSIAPTEHNNDKSTYMDALEKNHLNPRFARFQDNPNYMKLVNECRQSASQSKPVQPVFNEDAAMKALAKLEVNGYYQPIGGSVDRMYEIAAEVAEDMQSKVAPQMSLSNENEPRRRSRGNVYGEDIALAEDIGPVVNSSNAVSENRTFIDVITPDREDSTGAAPSGFDPVSNLQYEYGSLPMGEHPVREDSLPKSTTGKDKVSLTARTVKGAEATPDELVDLLDKETVGGRFSYIPIKNSDTVQKAYDEIVKKGWEAARGEWEAKVRRGEVSAELTATGSLLLNHAAKAGDRNAWLSVLNDYQIMGTNAGQAIQAMRILKTLTPDDSLYMIERSVEQMVEDMKLGADIVIDENLKQAYLNAKTDGERDSARQAIAKDVAKQIPSTAMDKWTALRYLNMLGNFRTQGRNIIGNLGMSVTTGARNAVATGIEWLANKASGGKFHRTRSLFVNKDQLKAAKNDFANVKDVALNGGKFNDPMAKTLQFQQEVQDARKIFKIAPLEWYRRATNWAMDTGDLVFSKMAYGRALAGYLKANGIKETDFSKIDQQTLDEARAYAINEAQETTFRDNNWLSSWVSKLGRGKNTPKGVKIVSEGVMPFRKTPANILLRAEEYSPLGLVNATVKSIQAAKGTKNVTGADVVNSWAKALTGTGLFALGMWLNNSGMLSGGPDEDDDKDWFEDLYGWQNYAIQIGDNNYTIDFLSPAAMPLLMGAQLNELRQTGGVELKDLEKALLSIADPMIEMSMLQGVNDTLDNIRYAESNMGQFLVNACVSYLTQGLTNSFLGQLERSFEGQRMSTYTDKDSDLPAWLQKALGKASAKTPGWDYNQIPYVDAWGEMEDIAPLPGFAENALSPSYISQGITDAVYEELNRLNDAQSDINVYPQTPDKTVTFDDAYGVRHEDYNLSAEEYVELAQLQGQTQKEMVEDILSNYRYSGLTDKEKARAVQLAYQYAKEYSRQEVLGADGFSSKWMADAAAEGDLVNAIIAHTNEEMTFAYDYPEKYQFFTENGISWDDYDSADEDTKREYSDMYSWVSDEDHPGRYSLAKAVSDDFQTFWQYKSDCNNFDAKDENGETVSGLKKERVIDYINSLDIDYGARLILFRSMYDGKKDKANYDQDIIDYLNSREDISYEDMEAILKELG